MAYTGRGTPAEFFRTVLKRGGANHFDILDIHYADRAALDSFRKDLKRHGGSDKPVWITEQSGHQVENRSLAGWAKQAADRTQGLVSALAGNPEKVFLWGGHRSAPGFVPVGKHHERDANAPAGLFCLCQSDPSAFGCSMRRGV